LHLLPAYLYPFSFCLLYSRSLPPLSRPVFFLLTVSFGRPCLCRTFFFVSFGMDPTSPACVGNPFRFSFSPNRILVVRYVATRFFDCPYWVSHTPHFIDSLGPPPYPVCSCFAPPRSSPTACKHIMVRLSSTPFPHGFFFETSINTRSSRSKSDDFFLLFVQSTTVVSKSFSVDCSIFNILNALTSLGVDFPLLFFCSYPSLLFFCAL